MLPESQKAREALLGTAQAYNQLIVLGIEQPFRIDQNNLDNAIANIASSGLPQVEVDFLGTAGWTNADIDSLGQYVGSLTLNLAVNDVSLSDCLVCSASTFQSVPEPNVPEPLTILGSVAAMGFGAYAERKRKPSKSSEKDDTKTS